MRRSTVSLALAQILLLVGLAGYTVLEAHEPTSVAAVIIPLEAPITGLSGLSQ
jgi:hypothetical protein